MSWVGPGGVRTEESTTRVQVDRAGGPRAVETPLGESAGARLCVRRAREGPGLVVAAKPEDEQPFETGLLQGTGT